MDWTNDMVLEFLQVFGTEPIIWDPKHPEHKKKQLLAEAWLRISQTLNWPCTIEDLKKKRDSLMAYYRIHLNKIRKLKNSGTGAEDDYKTNWFAFDTMHSFLGSIYDCQLSYIEDANNRPIPEFTDSANGSEYQSDSEYQPKRKRREEPDVALERVNTYSVNSSTYNNIPDKSMSECEMYVQLLVRKLNKLDEDDRLILMNKIDNLVFQTTLESNAKKKRALSAIQITSVNQVPNTRTESMRSRTPYYYDYNNDIPSPSYQNSGSPRQTRTDNSIIADSSHPHMSNINNPQTSNTSNANIEIKKEN